MEELEQLKELLADAKDLLAEFAVRKYREAEQLSMELEAERISEAILPELYSRLPSHRRPPQSLE